jgi:chemotaxis protein CheD
MGSPTIASLFCQRVVIGVGDMGVSNNQGMTLSTYALGSCVAVTAFDPAVNVGGILHLMLPDSGISAAKAAAQPTMFADTGLPLFFRQLAIFRSDFRRLRIFLAGGASVIGGNDPFRIGERNVHITLKLLGEMGVSVANADLRGTINRSVHLELATGKVTLKTPRGQSEFFMN